MPITLPEDTARVSTPVVKRQHIGDKFVGAVVRYEQRDVMKKNERTGDLEKSMKPNGRPRQELVVHCIAMPNTTAVAGIGDTTGVPEPGTEVRLILRGGAFGDWIESRKGHREGKLNVGDVVVQKVEFAQAYDASGAPKGPKLTVQAEADALPRNTAVGFYGPLTLHEPKDQEWVTKAETAWHAHNAIPLDGEPAADKFDDQF